MQGLIAENPTRPSPSPGRVESIDLVRGLVMVVMVLDPVRDFFGGPNVDPLDLATTTPALFLTRWITHFCAPTFVFLAGIGASLSGARRSRGDLAWRLLIRGAWLIVLEQTMGNVLIFFTFPHVVLVLVLWAMGWSMIALAALIYLPRVAIGLIALAMIFGHNRLDGIDLGEGTPGLAWAILHGPPGFRLLFGKVPILLGYPLIPWVGVMATGYALGPLFLRTPGRRRAILVALGLASIAGFLALRTINLYGDPRPWSDQSSPALTVLSFLDCRKYPPSLLFLLMTLGPAFLALAALDGGLGWAGGPLRTLGRVALFFYWLQWPVAHGLAVIVAAAQGFPIGWMFRFPPFRSPPGYGHALPTIYLFWAITVATVYYPCRWQARRRGLVDPA